MRSPIFYFIIFFLLVILPSYSEEKISILLGIETQVYPTGLIPGFRAELGLGNSDFFHIRTGFNIVQHGDLGVHQNEQGGGLGFSLGYHHHFFKTILQGFYVGPRVDVWFNRIEWQDNTNSPAKSTGVTQIIVVQPTLVTGYRFILGKTSWSIEPLAALGYEINAYTSGADVGQGLIFLLGVYFNYRFEMKSK